MAKYKFVAGGGKPGVNADRIGREIDSIRKETGGIASPAELVNRARNATSAMHGWFTWDDSKAAELHRQQEARRLLRDIRIVRVVEGEEQPPQRVYVSVAHSTGGKGGAYAPIIEAMSDDTMREQVIGDAIAGLNGWRKRYEEFSELAPAIALVDQAIATAKGKAKKAKVKPR
jgi:hypothetical protein